MPTSHKPTDMTVINSSNDRQRIQLKNDGTSENFDVILTVDKDPGTGELKKYLDFLIHPNSSTTPEKLTNQLEKWFTDFFKTYPNILQDMDDIKINGDFNIGLTCDTKNDTDVQKCNENRTKLSQTFQKIFKTQGYSIEIDFPKIFISKAREEKPGSNDQVFKPGIGAEKPDGMGLTTIRIIKSEKTYEPQIQLLTTDETIAIKKFGLAAIDSATGQGNQSPLDHGVVYSRNEETGEYVIVFNKTPIYGKKGISVPRKDFDEKQKAEYNDKMLLAFATNLDKILSNIKKDEILNKNNYLIQSIKIFEKELKEKLQKYRQDKNDSTYKELTTTMQKFKIDFAKLEITDNQKKQIFNLWKKYIENVWQDQGLLAQIKILEQSDHDFYINQKGEVKLNSIDSPKEVDQILKGNVSDNTQSQQLIANSIFDAAQKKCTDSGYLDLNYGGGNSTFGAFSMQKAGGFAFEGPISKENLRDIQDKINEEQIIEVGKQLIATGMPAQELYNILNKRCLIELGLPREKFEENPQYRDEILKKMGCEVAGLAKDDGNNTSARFIIIESDSHVKKDGTPLYSAPEYAVSNNEELKIKLRDIQSRMSQTKFNVFDGASNYGIEYRKLLPTKEEWKLRAQLKEQQAKIQEQEELIKELNNLLEDWPNNNQTTADPGQRTTSRPTTADPKQPITSRPTTANSRPKIRRRLNGLIRAAGEEGSSRPNTTVVFKNFAKSNEYLDEMLKKLLNQDPSPTPNYMLPTASSRNKQQSQNSAAEEDFSSRKPAEQPKGKPAAGDARGAVRALRIAALNKDNPSTPNNEAIPKTEATPLVRIRRRRGNKG